MGDDSTAALGALPGAGGMLGAGPFVEDRLRHGLQAPDEARPGQELQAVVGRIDLPPIESVAGG